MLDEFCSESIHASNLTKIHVKNTVSCISCSEYNITEDPLTILQVPVSDSVQSSIDSFLKPENLLGDNSYFCNVCGSLQPALLEHEFSKLGKFLIIQLKRFITFSNSVTKDTKVVTFNQELKVPVAVDNEITNQRSYKHIATINHSGSLNSGHYTSQILDPVSFQWYHCNDSAVLPCKRKTADSLGYILFYKAF